MIKLLFLYLAIGFAFVTVLTKMAAVPGGPEYKRGVEYFIAHIAVILFWPAFIAVMLLSWVITGLAPKFR